MFFGDLYLDPTKSPCLKKWPKSPFFLGGFIVPWPKSHVNRKERLRVEGTYFPIFVDQVSWIQRCFFVVFFPFSFLLPAYLGVQNEWGLDIPSY